MANQCDHANGICCGQPMDYADAASDVPTAPAPTTTNKVELNDHPLGLALSATAPSTPSAQMGVLVTNVLTTARTAGFARGRGTDDTVENRDEDVAVAELNAAVAQLESEVARLTRELDAAQAETDRLANILAGTDRYDEA